MDAITLHIDGDNRHIAPETFLRQVAIALRDRSLKAGDHHIEIDREGSVWLNGEKVYEPTRAVGYCVRAVWRRPHIYAGHHRLGHSSTIRQRLA